jgi:hypothetical protein
MSNENLEQIIKETNNIDNLEIAHNAIELTIRESN